MSDSRFNLGKVISLREQLEKRDSLTLALNNLFIPLGIHQSVGILFPLILDVVGIDAVKIKKIIEEENKEILFADGKNLFFSTKKISEEDVKKIIDFLKTEEETLALQNNENIFIPFSLFERKILPQLNKERIEKIKKELPDKYREYIDGSQYIIDRFVRIDFYKDLENVMNAIVQDSKYADLYRLLSSVCQNIRNNCEETQKDAGEYHQVIDFIGAMNFKEIQDEKIENLLQKLKQAGENYKKYKNDRIAITSILLNEFSNMGFGINRQGIVTDVLFSMLNEELLELSGSYFLRNKKDGGCIEFSSLCLLTKQQSTLLNEKIRAFFDPYCKDGKIDIESDYEIYKSTQDDKAQAKQMMRYTITVDGEIFFNHVLEKLKQESENRFFVKYKLRYLLNRLIIDIANLLTICSEVIEKNKEITNAHQEIYELNEPLIKSNHPYSVSDARNILNKINSLYKQLQEEMKKNGENQKESIEEQVEFLKKTAQFDSLDDAFKKIQEKINRCDSIIIYCSSDSQSLSFSQRNWLATSVSPSFLLTGNSRDEDKKMGMTSSRL